MVRTDEAEEAGMNFAIGDRVRLRAGGEAMEVIGLLEGGDVACCRPADPNQGATGLVTRHPGEALLPLQGAPGADMSGALRAETEPSDIDLGAAPPHRLPTRD